MIWYKQGVCGDLNGKCQKCMGRIHRSKEQNLFITSIRDGNHMAGSFHYIGQAFDMQKEGFTLSEIKQSAGKGFDVVEHSTHFHVEWDPKS